MQTIEECFAIYTDVRDPAWVEHRFVTKTLRSRLKSFVQQVGPDDAPTVFRAGLIAQRDGWAKGKNVDLSNLLSNDKVIHYAERSNALGGGNFEGRTVKLDTLRPDNRLPVAPEYYMNVERIENGRAYGEVYASTDPHTTVKLEISEGTIAGAA